MSSRTDYDGNVTCYANDPTRGLELVKGRGLCSRKQRARQNLGSYTPVSGTTQRMISTTWSTRYRLPTLITETARATTFGYDTLGNVLS